MVSKFYPCTVYLIGLVLTVTGHENKVTPGATFESRLYSRLLGDDYCSAVRPATGRDVPTTVRIKLSVYRIADLDARDHVLTILCKISQRWYDTRLMWNSTDYDGLNVIALPTRKIWKPDLRVLNGQFSSADSPTSDQAIVHSDGMMRTFQSVHIKTACPLDLSNFPHDSHICRLRFTSGAYPSQLLQLQFEDGGSGIEIMRDFIPAHPSWEVKDYQVYGKIEKEVIYFHPDPFDVISFSMTLRRKSGYRETVLILPLAMLSLLVVAVFRLPGNWDQRSTLGATILISLTMIGFLLNLYLPPSYTLATPKLERFYIITFTLVAISTVVSALTTSLARKKTNPQYAENWLFSVFLERCPSVKRFFCMDDFTAADDINSTTSTSVTAESGSEAVFNAESNSVLLSSGRNTGESGNSHSWNVSEHGNIARDIHTLQSRHKSKDVITGNNLEWMKIARVINRLCIALFVLLVLISALSTLL